MTVDKNDLIVDSDFLENEMIVEIGDTNELVAEIETTEEIIGEVNIGSGNGTSNYEYLFNKPQVNGVTLLKNKSLDELGIQPKGDYPEESLTNIEIENLINHIAL